MIACDLGDNNTGGGLTAPTGLIAAAFSSSEIYLYWNPVPGAVGYNVYQSQDSSTGFELFGTAIINMKVNDTLLPSTTFYYKVAAFTANGTEVAMSSIAYATTLNPNNYSLDGVWQGSAGGLYTVSGTSCVRTAWSTIADEPIIQDAKNKGYLQIGQTIWRNITSTGSLTWSGQNLHITYNTSNPNVATGTAWSNVTFTLSSDGQTLTMSGNDSSGPYTNTYTRGGTPITSVYIAGSYESGGVWNPCYWINGSRVDLPVPAGATSSGTSGIAVMGNTVYVSGYYSMTSETPRACYWANGVKTDLELPTGITYSTTTDIAVQGSTVYITGQLRSGSDRMACYWVNGNRTNITHSTNITYTVGISVEGTAVYILGLFGPTNDTKSFYWDTGVSSENATVNSISFQLPSGSGNNNYYSTPGAKLGNAVYVPGNVRSSSIQRACYWRDGYRTDLSLPAGITDSYTNALSIYGSTIYVAGVYSTGSSNQTGCYWTNGVRTDLTVPGAAITRAGEVVVHGSNIYVVGSYGSTVETRKACYWLNGNKTDLNVPAGATVSAPSRIMVVEN
ncbi:MAG: hypothetical protein FWC03_02155 [Treponema sp.]|nr:hypothetical protein [Treponema sp.]